jgi:Uma2 family endonuclease
MIALHQLPDDAICYTRMMPPTVTSSRPFEPGTTGWTVHDLDDPEIERQWANGRYEIVEGVLTTMPPGYFVDGNALINLIHRIKSHLEQSGQRGRFATGLDIVVDEDRVGRSDAAMLTPADEARQADAAKTAAPQKDATRVRILVPPTLIIEALSPGREQHDLKTKKRWYAEFGVPNYWVLDAFAKSLQCMVLEAGSYRTDLTAREAEVARPQLFPGLALELTRVWED